ncbi:MAG: hypothetical protein WCF90_02470 [Methanomicrobiales archaeon]
MSNKLIAVIVVIMILVSVIAATEGFYVPVFSEVLGTNKARDRGIMADHARFDALLTRGNVKLSGPASNFDLTANIQFDRPCPLISQSQVRSSRQ